MKKHIKAICILFLAVIVFEMLMVAYNQVVYKLYNKMHLINNETYLIEENELSFRKNDKTNIVSVDKKLENVYNLTLNLKQTNNDAYITLGVNDKIYTLKRDNVEATKFKAYFKEALNLENFEIYFNENELNIDNVKNITINDNLNYMPQKGIVLLRIATIFILGLIVYILFWVFKKINNKEFKISKCNFFVVAALVLGIGIGTLVIPLTKYDEHTHFWRAYEISERKILSSWNNQLPKSIIRLSIDENGEYHLYDRTYSDLRENLQTDLNKNDKEGLFVGGAAAYSPFNYIPQIVGILIGKILNLNPMLIVYMGRLTNFIAFIIFIYFAIRLMPKEKWKNIIIVVALLPMTLNLATSLSPDALAISLSMLLISYILNIKYKQEKIKPIQILILTGLCVMTSLVKIAYLPLVILFLLIPSDKFKNKKMYYAIFVAILLITIIINLLWMGISSGSSAAAIRTNPEEQVYFALANPLDFIKNMTYTIMENVNEYITTMIGGWNTTSFGTMLLVIVIVLTTFSANENNKNSKEDEITLKMRDKIIIAASIIFVILLIFAGLYMQWTVATCNRVEGIQGRYFLPILAISLILFEKDKFRMKIKNGWIKYFVILLIVYIPIYINIIKEYL